VGSEAAQNEVAGTDLLRFLIPSTAVRDIERRLEGPKQALVGFYHSHPGVEALPSECDLDNAWPWYTYLVTRATEGDVGPTRAFEWEPDPPRFVPIDLKVMPSRASVVVPQTLIPNHAPGA
ncbi:MAG: Mov34/MPN/PAD-1 family protein, partial [Thermoplasmata archaeon]|nr:Mov34/MPN/PAD-1 family protein [Thermoplasmata archaeon]